MKVGEAVTVEVTEEEPSENVSAPAVFTARITVEHVSRLVALRIMFGRSPPMPTCSCCSQLVAAADAEKNSSPVVLTVLCCHLAFATAVRLLRVAHALFSLC